MKKSIAVFGGGAASLAFASFIDTSKYDVTLYERNNTCGRKFLVAGKGGFNLTHSEPSNQMLEKYIPSAFLKDALVHFDNDDFRSWLAGLGIQTFVGTSNRVFPVKGIKPIQVLNSILKYIESNGVKIETNKTWVGWSDNNVPKLENGKEVKTDYTVFAFGGGSWKKTGSTGSWWNTFHEANIGVKPFRPSNCAYSVEWPEQFIEKHEGKPLKNIALSCEKQYIKGEVVVTKFGLEGSAIYALSSSIRHQLERHQKSVVYIDLKPQLTIESIEGKKLVSTSRNISEFLRKDLKLSKAQFALLKSILTKEEFQSVEKLLRLIKKLPLKINGMAPIDDAISTVGGIELPELTLEFELKKKAGTYCVGEMLDWDAPTGGYLLQACFSMGAYLADCFNLKFKF